MARKLSKYQKSRLRKTNFDVIESNDKKFSFYFVITVHHIESYILNFKVPKLDSKSETRKPLITKLYPNEL